MVALASKEAWVLNRTTFSGLLITILFANTHQAWGAAARSDPKRYWPGGVVPYEIDRTVPNPSPILKAMEAWSKAGITFRKRTNEADYVSFVVNGPVPSVKSDPGVEQPQELLGAVSAVGRAGGRQVIASGHELRWWRYAHEIGHSLGLYHEQIRTDRDHWVIIHFDNIIPEAQHNFEIKKNKTVDIGGFDIRSIMLYPWNNYAIDPKKPTITWRKDPSFRDFGAPMIQSVSDGDIQAIHYLYFEGGIKRLAAVKARSASRSRGGDI